MFKLKNEKQAMEQEAYLWSVSDMWAQLLFQDMNSEGTNVVWRKKQRDYSNVFL